MTPLQKLPKNVEDLGKLFVAKGIKNLPKVQKIAQSGHTARVAENWLKQTPAKVCEAQKRPNIIVYETRKRPKRKVCEIKRPNLRVYETRKRPYLKVSDPKGLMGLWEWKRPKRKVCETKWPKLKACETGKGLNFKHVRQKKA